MLKNKEKTKKNRESQIVENSKAILEGFLVQMVKFGI